MPRPRQVLMDRRFGKRHCSMITPLKEASVVNCSITGNRFLMWRYVSAAGVNERNRREMVHSSVGQVGIRRWKGTQTHTRARKLHLALRQRKVSQGKPRLVKQRGHSAANGCLRVPCNLVAAVWEKLVKLVNDRVRVCSEGSPAYQLNDDGLHLSPNSFLRRNRTRSLRLQRGLRPWRPVGRGRIPILYGY